MIVDDKTLTTMVNAYIATKGTPIEAMRAAVECIHIACPPRDELAWELAGAMDEAELQVRAHAAWAKIADRAIALCAGRVPAEAAGLVGLWRDRGRDAECAWLEAAGELEAALQSLQPASPPDALPVPMLLWCPECSARHIDVGEFATKVHHTHACQSCGHCWRPAVVPTCGVQFLPGFRDALKGSGE